METTLNIESVPPWLFIIIQMLRLRHIAKIIDYDYKHETFNFSSKYTPFKKYNWTKFQILKYILRQAL